MATKRKRGAYKFKFASNFDDAIVDPSTIRRWKKYAVDGHRSRQEELDLDFENEIAVDIENVENRSIVDNFTIPTVDSSPLDIENVENRSIEDNFTIPTVDSSPLDIANDENISIVENFSIPTVDSSPFADIEDIVDHSSSSSSSENSESSDDDIWNDIDFNELHVFLENETPKDDFTNLCNNVMFEPSKTTVWDAMNMVIAITLRFHLTDEAQQAILNLLKTLAGPNFAHFDTSKYFMNKLFNPSPNAIAYVFYCEFCYIPLHEPIQKADLCKKKRVAVCQKCDTQFQLLISENNFFISISLKLQLRNLLENESFRKTIEDHLNESRNKQDDYISDIIDSERYVNDDFIISKRQNGNCVLTFNCNLDGTPQFESGRHCIWPIQCLINEAPMNVRNKFMLLAGLWYTNKEPHPEFMNLYLSAFKSQIIDLMENGITIETKDGSYVKYFCKIFSFPVDSVARPVMQNRLQFNGLYACSWCYIKSTYVTNYMRFLEKRETPQLRTHARYLIDVKKRKKNIRKLRKTRKNAKYTVNGIKGPSILSTLPGFDCIWGYPYEYMHGTLLGVTRQLWDVWSADFLTAKNRRIINKRLLKIKPPKEIHRTPRILKKKNKWKATEWRSWLLFYSIPCLTNILDDELLSSFKLFVKSIHTLLTQHITEDDLFQCEIDILSFVYDCQQFYGPSFMTFNVHTLLHIAENVRQNGPLWASSAFSFESNINNLKEDVTSPKNVLGQIASRTLRRNTFMAHLYSAENSNSWTFCKNILNKKKELTRNFLRSNDEATLIKDKNAPDDNLYIRCIYKNIMLHSAMYNKAKKTDNSYVYLEGDRVGRILYFFLDDNLTFIKVKLLEVEICDNSNHIFKVLNCDESYEVTVQITAIISKLVYVSFENINSEFIDSYVCVMPNSFEVQ